MDILLPPGHDLPDWALPLESGRSIVTDEVSNFDYHGSRALVSKSALDVFDRSGQHYLHYLDTGTTDKDAGEVQESEALVIGSAFHSLVLEPMVFSKSYVRLPDFGDMRSSKNRSLRDGWLSERPGMIPLKMDQWTMIHGMRESVFRHKKLRRILENGRPEVTVAAIDPETGLVRKCRMDWESEIDRTALDLKSALDGRPDKWRSEAARRRYHVQDAYYTQTCDLAGLDLDTMAFGVVEKEPPYVCALYTLDPTARLAGELAYKRNLAGIAEACESGEFHGYSRGEVFELMLPKWATTETEGVT